MPHPYRPSANMLRRPRSPIFGPPDPPYAPAHPIAPPARVAPMSPSTSEPLFSTSEDTFHRPTSPQRWNPPAARFPSLRLAGARNESTSRSDSEDDSSSSHEYSLDMTPQLSEIRPEVKFLYNHSDSSDRRITWSEFEDPREEEARTRAATGCYSVVHRRKKSTLRDEAPWKTHSFVVNGAALRGVLKQVFKNYPRWMKERESFVFRPPFQQFFHRWEELKKAIHDNDSVKNEGSILIKELTPFMERHQKDLDAIIQRGVVSFDDLWLIYPPGEIVIRHIKGQPSACKIVSTEVRTGAAGSEQLIIRLKQFDWNGSYCGFEMGITGINSYDEAIPVTSLDVIPLKLKGDPQDVQDLEDKLLRRGRKFEQLRGFHIMKCKGSKFLPMVGNRTITEDTGRPVSILLSLCLLMV